MATYSNKNDFFYNIIKTKLLELKSYDSKLQVLDYVDESVTPSLSIAMTIETKVQEEAMYSYAIIQKKIAEFEVVFCGKTDINRRTTKTTRENSYIWNDLIEMKIKKVYDPKLTYTYKNPVTNLDEFVITFLDIDVNRIWKTVPVKATDLYYIMFECEIKYQQRLLKQ